MEDILLLKLGEIVLKGQNRKQFERKLLSNVIRALKPFGDFKVYSLQSAIYAEPQSKDCDMDGAFAAAKCIFGVVSISRAAACEKDKDMIARTAVSYLRESLAGACSFKVESKRADKAFPMTSIQLSQYVGGYIHTEMPELTVNVHNPDVVVNVEVRDLSAYVHTAPEPGAGGLPVGSGGRAVSLLSGGIDSPVSTYMIAKRGVSIIPVHFFSFPYTSEQAKEKVLELASILTRYCGKMTVEIVPFTHIQEEIRRHCPEALFTLIMRRFMMQIAQAVCERNGGGALVTGENLGQVASQTMEAMAATEASVSLPVLRPLVGMDKEEIVGLARKIGTFETSILPYEDCCTVFTPRHPRTKPRLDEVIRAEEKLNIEELIAEALAGIERIRVEG